MVTPDRSVDLEVRVRRLQDKLFELVDLAQTAFERQLVVRASLEELVVGDGFTLQDVADALGITVDTLDDLLTRMPMTLHERLGMSQASVDSLLFLARERGARAGPGQVSLQLFQGEAAGLDRSAR